MPDKEKSLLKVAQISLFKGQNCPFIARKKSKKIPKVIPKKN
jgi:hypothetical protein